MTRDVNLASGRGWSVYLTIDDTLRTGSRIYCTNTSRRPVEVVWVLDGVRGGFTAMPARSDQTVLVLAYDDVDLTSIGRAGVVGMSIRGLTYFSVGQAYR